MYVKESLPLDYTQLTYIGEKSTESAKEATVNPTQ